MSMEEFTTEKAYLMIKGISDKELKAKVAKVIPEDISHDGRCLLEAYQALAEARANKDYV